ncbi:MAG: hypothetical protein IKA36_04155 [Clostridia bacterium]|nr:hypothetical protein [Clostridia bacterium]
MCMKHKCVHHSCYKGKRCRVLIPNNVIYEGRFIEERSQSIVITINNNKVNIPRKDLLSFGISRSGLPEGVYHKI